MSRKNRMLAVALAALVLASVGVTTGARAETPMPWLDATKTAEQRADVLVAAMNNDQLVHMLHGESMLIGGKRKDGLRYIGYIPPIPELRIPALVMSDGPAGLRNGDKATAMPAPIVEASSFDPQIVREYNRVIAQEAAIRGQDMIFAPGFNLARNPQAGRTFEYYGEDPFLSGTLASAAVHGLQNNGIMANLKHFVANNQETNRTLNSSNIDPRTLHEIYEKPFYIAVQGSEPASVMCAYNKVNNTPACGNGSTLNDDLRGYMGFKGFVVTDYPAAWATTDIANGLNVELPSGKWTSKGKVDAAVRDGKLTWDQVRAQVRGTLVQMFRFGMFEKPWDPTMGDRLRELGQINAAESNKVAQATTEAGAVLLKNDGALPLAKPAKVLLVGNGAKKAQAGGGSSAVSVTPDSTLDAITKRLPGAQITWKSEWDPIGIAQAAKASDVVIVFATQDSTELFDQQNMRFWPHINNAVNLAADNNKNTIVVTQIGVPRLMPWLDKVRAVLNVWYPGQAGGEATARLLFGEVNPSGRLPQTFPAREDQKPASTAAQFPGANLGFQSNYTEGVFMGYRWYSSKGEKPLFPFGYGLSYSTFTTSGPTLSAAAGSASSSVDVTLTVANTGKVAGAVTPQIYVSKPASVEGGIPVRELAGFSKVQLEPGESKTVTIKVDPLQLAVWDVAAGGGKGAFVVKPGNYTIAVGDNVDALVGAASYTVR